MGAMPAQMCSGLVHWHGLSCLCHCHGHMPEPPCWSTRVTGSRVACFIPDKASLDKPTANTNRAAYPLRCATNESLLPHPTKVLQMLHSVILAIDN